MDPGFAQDLGSSKTVTNGRDVNEKQSVHNGQRCQAMIAIILHSSNFPLHQLECLHTLIGKGLITLAILMTLGGLSHELKQTQTDACQVQQVL